MQKKTLSLPILTIQGIAPQTAQRQITVYLNRLDSIITDTVQHMLPLVLCNETSIISLFTKAIQNNNFEIVLDFLTRQEYQGNYSLPLAALRKTLHLAKAINKIMHKNNITELSGLTPTQAIWLQRISQ